MQEEIEIQVIPYHLKELNQLLKLLPKRKTQAQAQPQIPSLVDSFQIFQGKNIAKFYINYARKFKQKILPK